MPYGKLQADSVQSSTPKTVTVDSIVTTGDTGTVTSTMLANGTIVNEDVNASAAIAGTKISPDFGAQNVTTTGTSTAASYNPTSATVPTNGVYLPAANSVGISTNGTGRLFVDASGNVGVGVSSPQGTLSIEGEGRVVTIGDSGTANRPIIKSRNATNDGYAYLHYDAFEHRFFDSGVLSSVNGQNTHIFYTNNTERLRVTAAGLVGIGTTSPATTNGGLDISSGGIGLIVGADANATTKTDSTTKASRIAVPHYTNAEEPLAIAVASSESSNSYVNIGGGTSSLNAATDVRFFTAANTTTTTGTERARIDSSGRLLVGTSANVAAGGSLNPLLQISSTAGAGSGLYRWSANATGQNLSFCKSRGASIGTRGIVSTGDQLGQVFFDGDDGTNFVQAASITAAVDGTPGANSMPGRIVLSTTASGASSPAERMRIDSAGQIGVGTTPPAGTNFVVGKAITGATASFAIRSRGTIQSDVTSEAVLVGTFPATVAESFTLSRLYHFYAVQNTIGAGSTVTNQYGYYADSSLVGATNDFGFYSDIASGSNRWNFYANGTAANRFNGNVLIGGTTQPASATLALCLSNGTAPTGSITDGVVLYAEDVSSSSELKVRDEAGNVTTLSPHNFELIPEGPSEDMAWSYYSERDGKRINVDMLKAIRLLEQLTGEKLVFTA